MLSRKQIGQGNLTQSAQQTENVADDSLLTPLHNQRIGNGFLTESSDEEEDNDKCDEMTDNDTPRERNGTTSSETNSNQSTSAETNSEEQQTQPKIVEHRDASNSADGQSESVIRDPEINTVPEPAIESNVTNDQIIYISDDEESIIDLSNDSDNEDATNNTEKTHTQAMRVLMMVKYCKILNVMKNKFNF